MTIISVPIKEVDGLEQSNKDFFASGFSFQVCSHKDRNLVSLRFLNTTITLEASKLQSAIQSISEDRYKTQHA